MRCCLALNPQQVKHHEVCFVDVVRHITCDASVNIGFEMSEFRWIWMSHVPCLINVYHSPHDVSPTKFKVGACCRNIFSAYDVTCIHVSPPASLPFLCAGELIRLETCADLNLQARLGIDITSHAHIYDPNNPI
jgi:hypothetical protein